MNWQTQQENLLLWYVQPSKAMKQVNTFLLDWINPSSLQGTTLDVGCGIPSDNCLQLWNYIKNYTGIDPFAISPNIETTIEDYNSPILYDNVISISTLQHTKQPTIAINKILSYLKPGGNLILTVYLNTTNNPLILNNITKEWVLSKLEGKVQITEESERFGALFIKGIRI